MLVVLCSIILQAPGLFLERPGILIWEKVGCVLTSNEVHFVFLAEKLHCIIFKSIETPIWNGKQNSLTGPVITGSFEKQAPGEKLWCHDVTHVELGARSGRHSNVTESKAVTF